MTHVPRNSLMGWAELWRMTISFMAWRNSLLVFSKRSAIFFSAMNALMMRRPPSVSSSCDMMSPHCAWAADDWRFSLRLTTPMTHPARGSTTSTKSVIFQLMVNSVVKQTTRAIGLRMSMSMELVSEFSTTVTSALMRAMMSPLRSSEKKLSGRRNTLLYTCTRMSRTMPVRRGTITAEEAKYPAVLSRVMRMSRQPMKMRVRKAPWVSMTWLT